MVQESVLTAIRRTLKGLGSKTPYQDAKWLSNDLHAAGFAIVPMEPTRTMKNAAVDATNLGAGMSWLNLTPQIVVARGYRAALAAYQEGEK